MIIYYKAMLRVRRGAFQREPGNALQGFAGRFQKGPAARLGRDAKSNFNFWRAGKMSKISRPFEGVLPNLERLYHRERKRIHPQPAQALHEPAVLRRLQGQAAEAGNSGGDAWDAAKSEFSPMSQSSQIRNRKLEIENSRPVHHGRLRAVGGKGG